MIDVQEKKNKIISFLKTTGPSLPVHIARAIQMDPIFASAIISELISTKQIKTSHMKIGASPLYFIPGQEQKLEEHSNNLKSAEHEAYTKLKETKILNDEKEEPSSRVALRNIKDFAIPFKHQERILWKYAFTPDEEIQEILNPKKEEPKPYNQNDQQEKRPTNEATNKKSDPIAESDSEVPKAWKLKKEEPKENQEKNKNIEDIFAKTEEQKDENEFLTETKKFLQKQNIKFLEEIRTEKKEIMATIIINSQLGETNFLLIAKNKKTITKDEIDASIQIATKNKMPCLLIIRRQPSNTIQKIIEENHLIKLKIMK